LVIAIIAVIAGCSSQRTNAAGPHPVAEEHAPAPDLTPAPMPATILPNVCPHGLLEGFAWAREVFPGCPPPPFVEEPVNCEGACPMPCRVVVVDPRDGEYDEISESSYDQRGRMIRWTTPEHTTTVLYDGDRLTQWSQTHSQAYTFNYDTAGRLVERVSATEGLDATYRYDAQGHVIEIRDGGLGGSNLTYDEHGRLATLKSGYGDVGYAYDDAGRILSTTRDGKPDRAYTYDPIGLLVKLDSARSGDHFTLSYDVRRRPLKIVKTRINRVTEKLDTKTWSYTYDCR